MKTWLKHPLRLTLRFLWMASELALAALRFAFQCSFRSADTAISAQAAWMQHTAGRLLRIFATETRVIGPIPAHGLLISNHLSYLDVIVLGSLTSSVFVAKHDVKSWPVFGWLASRAGTVYVNRERRAQVGQVADQMQTVLAADVLVILFPEGTSSDGRTVLPFKSSLLEPATQPAQPLCGARSCFVERRFVGAGVLRKVH